MSLGRRIADYFNIEPLVEYFQNYELVSRVLSNYFENLLQLYGLGRELNLGRLVLFPLLVNSSYNDNLIMTVLDEEFARHLLEETDYSEYPDLDTLVDIYGKYINRSNRIPVLFDVLSLLPILPLSRFTLNNLSRDLGDVLVMFLPVIYVEDLGYIPIVNIVEKIHGAVSRYVPNLKIVRTIRSGTLLNVADKGYYVERLIDELIDDIVDMLGGEGKC